jgi:hypothetical protein
MAAETFSLHRYLNISLEEKQIIFFSCWYTQVNKPKRKHGQGSNVSKNFGYKWQGKYFHSIDISVWTLRESKWYYSAAGIQKGINPKENMDKGEMCKKLWVWIAAEMFYFPGYIPHLCKYLDIYGSTFLCCTPCSNMISPTYIFIFRSKQSELLHVLAVPSWPDGSWSGWTTHPQLFGSIPDDQLWSSTSQRDQSLKGFKTGVLFWPSLHFEVISWRVWHF